MRNDASKESGFGAGAPGIEVLSLDSDPGDEMAMVSLFASVPNRSLPLSFVRFNLFGQLGNTMQHIASALAPAGTSGELIAVSGHVVDSYHVLVQATQPTQDIKANLAARACCASPKVEVRADMLALAFAAAEVGLGALLWYPLVPWGGAFGAAQTFTVTGDGAIDLPPGARLTHWLAQGGNGGPGTVEFNPPGPFGTPIAGPILDVGGALPAREGFPAAPAIANITFTNLVFGLFEVVV